MKFGVWILSWSRPVWRKAQVKRKIFSDVRRCLSTSSSYAQRTGKSDAKVFSSSYPNVDIPMITYPQFALNQMDKFRNNLFMVNGETGAEYTYHDSLREICRVSSGLIRRGLRPGDKVAFFGYNQPEYVHSWFAATAAGAVATDANPNFTANEFRDQLILAEAKYLFVHQNNAKKAKEAAASIPSIKKIFVFGNAESCEPYSELVKDSGDLFRGTFETDPSNAVHLPCSSGTTGLPKAVIRSHTNLVATSYVTDNDKIRLFHYGDVGLIVLPLFHMYGNFLVGSALLAGAKIILQEKFSPEQTLELLQKYKVSTFYVVPPLVLFLAQHQIIKNYDLSCLKRVMSGAAPVSPEVLESLKAKMNLSYIGQGYGSSEMCPISIFATDDHELSSAGRIVSNTQIKVVNLETGEDLGYDSTGEILSRGPQVMTGYLNNTEATNSTFVDGWLKTGDIGYFRKDGYLFVVDRLKDFIKVKGHQVAPAELESLLLTHPAVQDVAVIGVQDQRSGEVPKAFVVLKDKNIGVAELKSYVAERSSPEKHLAGGVVVLDQIPKSASGKILKKDLRKMLD